MKRMWRLLGVLAVVLVGAFLLLRVPDTDAAAMRAKYGGRPSQFVQLSTGPTVHLRDEGPRGAPVLVLLHGSNADLHTWDAWTQRLSGKYRIIRYDQRGHGLTGPAPDGIYDTDAFAADLDALAAKLGLGTFVLAGNSMGGGIAARYAMLNPDHLAGLVLVDAGGAAISSRGKGNLAFTIARIPVVRDIAFQLMPRSVIEKSIHQSVLNQSVVTPATVDRYFELARYPGNRAATIARFGQGYSTFTPAQVAAIRVPTLILWGEGDPLIPFAAAGWYKDHLPDAKLVSYPGIGHIPMEEVADRSAVDVSTFIDSLQGPAQPVSPSVPVDAAKVPA